MVPPVADTRRPIWPNSNGQTAYFPMSAIFIFAAAYDLSAALTELRVAIRLCDGRGRNEGCSPPHANQHHLDCCNAHGTSEMGHEQTTRPPQSGVCLCSLNRLQSAAKLLPRR